MRVAVISDIHGNQIAFDAVLQDLAQQPAVDQLVIAGDLCLNGPCPRQVLEMIQGLNCPVVQGNVDSEIVTEAPEKSLKKRTTVAWTREQIGLEGIDYLARCLSLTSSHILMAPTCWSCMRTRLTWKMLFSPMLPTTRSSICWVK